MKMKLDKNWPDTDMDLSHKEYIKDFRWLKYWVKNYLPKIVNKLLFFLFYVIGFLYHINLNYIALNNIQKK